MRCISKPSITSCSWSCLGETPARHLHRRSLGTLFSSRFSPDWVEAIGAWAGAFAAIATIVWAVRAFQKEAADKTGSVSWRWTRNLGGCSLSLVE
jgi:hypothetical protein